MLGPAQPPPDPDRMEGLTSRGKDVSQQQSWAYNQRASNTLGQDVQIHKHPVTKNQEGDSIRGEARRPGHQIRLEMTEGKKRHSEVSELMDL